MRFATLLSAVLLSATTAATAGKLGGKTARERVEELRAKRFRGVREQGDSNLLERKANNAPLFLNANTTKFAVNGTAIPEVDFDVGESYAGSLPISNSPSEMSNLFFWFFPSTNPAAKKEIVIWLNGGPGCSSLEGFIQENGPISWQYGTYKPVSNPWSWHTLTNMVWIEQPVGTGFSTGKVTATSEQDVAKQFLGFWKNFIDTFSMQGYKVYIAGESYAGLYCPYIANAMLDAKDSNYYNMSGVLMYSPVIAVEPLQGSIPIVPFVEYWKGLFPFNDRFRSQLHALDKKCGFSDYVNQYLVFPPKGNLPSRLPGTDASGRMLQECDQIFFTVYQAAAEINPCFDYYQVATTCPLLWDVLGFPGSFEYSPAGASVYFDRADVKAAIHAPNIKWELCSSDPVFVGRHDSSAPSIISVLPSVVDRTKNVIIGHGNLDMVLMGNGTLLALQNMTWGGKLGFQRRPTDPFYVPYSNIGTPGTDAGAGVFGTTITERGLTFMGINLAGHMVPQYAPSVAYRHVEFLLGRVNCLNCTVPFTTEKGIAPPQIRDLGFGTSSVP
ncbi:Alpha/Beta hydrolase protein [Lasiosphaeris hirsuta]|uniref:Carboxypeptidase n=1 Tax=Lasiosphaeris hirsuta TaxID=260670 RepID=A0AA40ARS9_9PEZI|nr:Alpha/Beta hydrolase protein [Lasiosphaeris hirsuta]